MIRQTRKVVGKFCIYLNHTRNFPKVKGVFVHISQKVDNFFRMIYRSLWTTSGKGGVSMDEGSVNVLLHGSSTEDLDVCRMLEKVGFPCIYAFKDSDGPELFVGSEKFVGSEEILRFLSDWLGVNAAFLEEAA